MWVLLTKMTKTMTRTRTSQSTVPTTRPHTTNNKTTDGDNNDGVVRVDDYDDVTSIREIAGRCWFHCTGVLAVVLLVLLPLCLPNCLAPCNIILVLSICHGLRSDLLLGSNHHHVCNMRSHHCPQHEGSCLHQPILKQKYKWWHGIVRSIAAKIGSPLELDLSMFFLQLPKSPTGLF